MTYHIKSKRWAIAQQKDSSVCHPLSAGNGSTRKGLAVEAGDRRKLHSILGRLYIGVKAACVTESSTLREFQHPGVAIMNYSMREYPRCYLLTLGHSAFMSAPVAHQGHPQSRRKLGNQDPDAVRVSRVGDGGLRINFIPVAMVPQNDRDINGAPR
jgi:hypothetical protein